MPYVIHTAKHKVTKSTCMREFIHDAEKQITTHCSLNETNNAFNRGLKACSHTLNTCVSLSAELTNQNKMQKFKFDNTG